MARNQLKETAGMVSKWRLNEKARRSAAAWEVYAAGTVGPGGGIEREARLRLKNL